MAGNTYTKTGAWQLAYADPQREDGGKQPPGVAAEASAGKTWMRDVYRLILYRVCEGLQDMDSQVGDTSATLGAALEFTGGTMTKVIDPSLTFTCIENPLVQEIPGTDIWREGITWEYRGAWSEQDSAT